MPGVAGVDEAVGPSEKAAVRTRARAQRRARASIDAQGLATNALAFLGGIAGPARTTCYVSYGTEPPTGPMIEALESADFTVLLPRVKGDDLDWVDSRGPRSVSAMGIEEPTGPGVPLLPVRALLIPALAVDLTGGRIGKGGGFYDRVLATLPADVPVAAIVGDDDIVDEIPLEPHDRPVDALITPSRIVWVSHT